MNKTSLKGWAQWNGLYIVQSLIVLLEMGSWDLRLRPALRSLKGLSPASTWKKQPCPPTEVPRLVPHFTLFCWGRRRNFSPLFSQWPTFSFPQPESASSQNGWEKTDTPFRKSLPYPVPHPCPQIRPGPLAPAGHPQQKTVQQKYLAKVWRILSGEECLQNDFQPVQFLSTVSCRVRWPWRWGCLVPPTGLRS